jgi:Holliday junction resolvase
MVNSIQKGKAGEREFAAFLRSYGIEARRGQQFAGGNDSPDVVHSIPDIHFEVKRTEKVKLWEWLEQAYRDAKGEEAPVIAWRRNQGRWIAILPMCELMVLLGYEWNGHDAPGN